jgi:hypothetical protein
VLSADRNCKKQFVTVTSFLSDMALFAPHCETQGSRICVTDRSASHKTFWTAGPAPDTRRGGRPPLASWSPTGTRCSWLRADGYFHRGPWPRALPADVVHISGVFRISQHFALASHVCCPAGWSHSRHRPRPTVCQLKQWATWTHRPQGRITSWTWIINNW